MPDSLEDEGCKTRILTSCFLRLDTSIPKEEAFPYDTIGCDDMSLYAIPIILPHLRQRSLVLQQFKPKECLEK